MKILGYVLLVLGAALLVLKLAFEDVLQKVPYIGSYVSTLDQMWTIIIGAGAAVIGLLLILMKRRTQKATEVPIYHKEKIVGYRKK